MHCWSLRLEEVNLMQSDGISNTGNVNILQETLGQFPIHFRQTISALSNSLTSRVYFVSANQYYCRLETVVNIVPLVPVSTIKSLLAREQPPVFVLSLWKCPNSALSYCWAKQINAVFL